MPELKALDPHNPMDPFDAVAAVFVLYADGAGPAEGLSLAERFAGMNGALDIGILMGVFVPGITKWDIRDVFLSIVNRMSVDDTNEDIILQAREVLRREA